MRSDPWTESETCELKKSLAELKEGLISIVAILNKHGAGELWFGVAPNGKAVGLDVTDKTLRDLSQAIAAHIEPKMYPQVSTQTVAGKTCIHIRFDGQNAPYFAFGRAYMRVADEDRQLSAAELEQLIVDKNQAALRWDNRALDKPWPALDTQKVKRFVQRARLQWDTLGNDDETRLQRALEKLELHQKGELCNAARLFFADQPIQLRCAVFANTGTATIIDRHDFDGDILELVEEAQKYILKNIHIGMRLEGLYRVDVPEMSMDALREAIVNAFCHRDWRDPDYVHVAIFKDRVEIRNPGTLYGGLTIEDLHRGNVSKRRNPLIADLFRRIDMVEAWGRGMTLIHQNAPNVTFRQVAGLFIASFARPSFSLNDQEAVEKTVDKTVDNGNKPTLTAREEALLRLLASSPHMTQKQLADQMGLTERGVRYLTDKLQKMGLLQRQGGKKAGQWVVAQAPKSEATK
ncbi:MAG: putative DNA binding domain-containing protein [Xylophilus sp.]|nr:putative DNA binding domain-containing protein [Xylophilus sp.]